MLLFWVAAAALSLAAAALIVARAARAARTPAEADPSLALYRRQLGEIDDLVERGLLDEAERRAAQAEASRRLLAAADRGGAAAEPRGPGRTFALAAAAGAPLAAVALYFAIGSPGLPDQPFASRIAGWRSADPATLTPAQMAAVLETIVRQRPGDVEGLRFLAQAQLAAGDAFQAESSVRKALAVAPGRADLWVLLGGALSAQEEATVVGTAATGAYEEALKRDPNSATALYFAGRGRIEAGRTAEGLALWRTLLEAVPAGAPERAMLSTEIATVERTGRLAPPAQPDQTGGAEMQAAVRGMVEGLAARLAAAPDDPDGWVRLVRSYTVLGETAKRDAALAQARERFKDRPDVLQALEQAVQAQ